MGDTNRLQRLERKKAKSGKVDYAPMVVLHETSRTRLNALALFIPHTDYTEFNLKLEGFTKQADKAWQLDKLKSMNLSEPASRELLKFLQAHLPLAEQAESGEFILLRVASGEADLGAHDPQEIVAALTKVLGQKELVSHLAGTELSHELSTAIRGAIRISEMRSAVAELREFLDTGQVNEHAYQKWCEDHCWAFGNAYVMRDEVRNISTGDSLDLMLPSVIAGYRDIVELKRPDKDVLVHDPNHRNYYFSSEVSKAIGQCHRYLDVLHEEAENGLRDHREVVAYHPRATIVVGRSHSWEPEQQRALHGLNRRLHGISVMTYDHLLAQGERLLDMMSPKQVAGGSVMIDDPDEIPW